MKLKRTDIVEQAAEAIYEALKRSLEEHDEIVTAIRADLDREDKRDR